MATSTSAEPIYYDPYNHEIDSNPHPVWHRMREEQPLYWNEEFGFWALSRFADVLSAYQDTTTFSSTHGVQLEGLDKPVEFASMIFMDPPEHDILRQLVSRAFTPKRIGQLEASIDDLVSHYLDPFLGEPTFDFVKDFAALVPPMVIGELLGVPEEDRNMLRLLVDDIFELDEHNEPTETAVAAQIASFEYIAAMVDGRRKALKDDMLSALIEAEIVESGVSRHLSDMEIIMFIMLLNGAGVETVARLLSWSAVILARHPDQREIVVGEPALVANAIDELLRYEAPSPVNGRWVTQPVEFYGTTIPAESKILLLNGSANRDDREFEDPDTFDVLRKAKRHITFGYGAHYCLGAALARLEGRVALAGALKRFPRWEINEDELVMVRTSTVRGYSSVPVHVG